MLISWNNINCSLRQKIVKGFRYLCWGKEFKIHLILNLQKHDMISLYRSNIHTFVFPQPGDSQIIEIILGQVISYEQNVQGWHWLLTLKSHWYRMKFRIQTFLFLDRSRIGQNVSFGKLDGIIYIPYAISYSFFKIYFLDKQLECFCASYQVEIEVVTLGIKTSFHLTFHISHYSQKNGNI